MKHECKKTAAAVVRKSLSAELTIDESDERTVLATISTIDIDRDGEVLLPSGVNLKEFRRNPVILYQHDSGAIPIGQATDVKISGAGVAAKIKFAQRPDSLPETVEWTPDTLWSLVKEGVLRAFSVGFLVNESRAASSKDIEQFGEQVKRVISKWTIIEVSLVTIPANPAAVAVAVSKSLAPAR
jgi:HK97 family phage prohead protease